MDGPEKEKMHKIQLVVFLPKIAGYYSNDFKIIPKRPQGRRTERKYYNLVIFTFSTQFLTINF